MKASLEAEAIIGEALTRLAIARGGVVDRLQSEVYLEDLLDQEPEVVRRACERLRRTPRAEFETALPDVGTIREMCRTIAREDAAEVTRQKLLPPPNDEDPRTWRHCIGCDDSGWQESWCVGSTNDARPEYRSGLPILDCGRTIPHTGHAFVNRCECVNRNPVIARRREQDAQFVARQATPRKRAR